RRLSSGFGEGFLDGDDGRIGDVAGRVDRAQADVARARGDRGALLAAGDGRRGRSGERRSFAELFGRRFRGEFAQVVAGGRADVPVVAGGRPADFARPGEAQRRGLQRRARVVAVVAGVAVVLVPVPGL